MCFNFVYLAAILFKMASSKDRLRAAARKIGDRTVLITCWIEEAETKKRDWEFCNAYLGTTRLCQLVFQEIGESSRLGLQLFNEEHRNQLISAEVFVGGLDSSNSIMRELAQDKSWLFSQYVLNSFLYQRSLVVSGSGRILPFNQVILNFESAIDNPQQRERRFMNEGEKQVLNRITTLLEDKFMADVVFIVGAEEFPAHVAFLAATSPVFLAMFQHDFQESRNRIVYVEDVNPQTFRNLLEYIYTGSVSQVVDYEDLLVAADKYDIDSLKEECSNVLVKNLDNQNVIPVLVLAHRYSASHLYAMAKHFMVRNGRRVCLLPDYEELMRNYPEICLEVTKNMLGVK